MIGPGSRINNLTSLQHELQNQNQNKKVKRLGLDENDRLVVSELSREDEEVKACDPRTWLRYFNVTSFGPSEQRLLLKLPALVANAPTQVVVCTTAEATLGRIERLVNEAMKKPAPLRQQVHIQPQQPQQLMRAAPAAVATPILPAPAPAPAKQSLEVLKKAFPGYMQWPQRCIEIDTLSSAIAENIKTLHQRVAQEKYEECRGKIELGLVGLKAVVQQLTEDQLKKAREYVISCQPESPQGSSTLVNNNHHELIGYLNVVVQT